jgi:hypothetical protein
MSPGRFSGLIAIGFAQICRIATPDRWPEIGDTIDDSQAKRSAIAHFIYGFLSGLFHVL